jgi:predicted O-linked N-acetylglucosamine transferase (SPINDLY family)
MTKNILHQANAAVAQGFAMQRQGRRSEAWALYEKALRLQPAHFYALQLLGSLALDAGEPQRACDLMARSILIEPRSGVAYLNQGVAQTRLGRHRAALASFDTAVALSYREADVYCFRGGALHELNRWEESVASYDAALALKRDYAEAFLGRGAPLFHLRRLDAALQSFDRAIALNPRCADAHNNRANVLSSLQRYEEALAGYDVALALRPHYADAWYNRGNALRELGRYEPAVGSYDRAAAYGMPDRDLRAVRRYAMMQMCDWRDFAEDVARIKSGIEAATLVSNPFFLIACLDSPSHLRRAAEIWSAQVTPPESAPNEPPALIRSPSHARIRIGYFSADFHNHATMYLIAGLFELHDRARFEVTAFSFGHAADDAMRRRLLAACERFEDVARLSDADIARLARERGIDIAVDLKGYTESARPGIFAQRAAPVQIGFLGFPGTMGAAHVDMLIADRIVVPEGAEHHYPEKIVFLPDSYQVNDMRRARITGVVSRRQAGLPLTGFVYACFNNNYKITPGTFAVWMRILERVPASVLWLLEDSSQASHALRREAAARGVAAERLLFAPRVSRDDHLERHVCADLFLDTFPCNAHTTASDALWAGVPVLTRTGDTFAGRVAASLLAAVGLAELAVPSDEAYEDAAVATGQDAARATALKRRLDSARATAPLFDTPLFTKRLEAAYELVHARALAGRPLDHVHVGA